MGVRTLELAGKFDNYSSEISTYIMIKLISAQVMNDEVVSDMWVQIKKVIATTSLKALKKAA